MRSFLLSLLLGTALAADARAQNATFDFLGTDGGFAQLFGPADGWTWQAGSGWQLNDPLQNTVRRLFSPVFVASGGAITIQLTHEYDFQSGGSAQCADGGLLFGSVNGGAFKQLTPISGTPYQGELTGPLNNLSGFQAFCGASSGLVTSVFTTTLDAGSTLRLGFDGAWDEQLSSAPTRNWRLTKLSVVAVPEPHAFALLLAGVMGLTVMARRRRIAQA